MLRTVSTPCGRYLAGGHVSRMTPPTPPKKGQRRTWTPHDSAPHSDLGKGWLALSHCGHLRVDEAPSLLLFVQCGWWHNSLPLGDLRAASSDVGRQRKGPGVRLLGSMSASATR